MAISVYLLMGAIAIAIAVIRYRAARNPVDRFVACGLPIAAWGAVMCLWLVVVQGSQLDWNEGKLAPVVAMTHGYKLYQPPGGVLTGWLYGPIAAILLLPTTLAHDPTTAVFVGIIICMMIYFAPAWWTFSKASAGRMSAPALIALLFLAFQSDSVEDLYRCIAVASPDACAIGLATSACAVIYRSTKPLNLAWSSILVVLCIWTKQNFLPLPLGILLWVALSHGMKTAGMFAAMLAGAGVVISGILIPIFGASDMYFHMVTLPASHPWRNPEHGKFVSLLIGIRDLIYSVSTTLGLLGGAVILDAFTRPPSKGLSAWLRDRPWSLLAFAGISMIPGVLPPYLKVGGYDNSLAPVDFLLLLAALAAIVEAWTMQQRVNPAASRIISAGMMLFVLVIGLRCTIARSAYTTVQSWPLLLHPYRNTQQLVFEYAQKHPTEIYCPWNPLTTLLTDKKLYHFEWGIFDLAYSKYPTDPDQFRSSLPAHMTSIVYLSTPQSTAAFDVFLDFRRPGGIPELADCVVFSKGP